MRAILFTELAARKFVHGEFGEIYYMHKLSYIFYIFIHKFFLISQFLFYIFLEIIVIITGGSRGYAKSLEESYQSFRSCWNEKNESLNDIIITFSPFSLDDVYPLDPPLNIYFYNSLRLFFCFFVDYKKEVEVIPLTGGNEFRRFPHENA